MSLPIAVGGKALSSKIIPPPIPQDDFADDGTTLQSSVINTGPSIAICTSSTLEATISISYYDLNRLSDGRREVTVAEIRVQISPLASAYTSIYREVLHRILLPHYSEIEGYENEKTTNSALMPNSVFAKNGRHLACVVPYPRGDSRSAVVVFQMRRPRRSSQSQEIPTSSYVSKEHLRSTGSSDEALQPIPIATNPLIVTITNENGSISPLFSASCLCDLSMQIKNKTVSVLVAGCSDGSLQILTYRPATVARVLYQSTEESSPIICMSHETFEQPEFGDCKGKLVTINKNGKAVVFESQCGRDDMQGSFASMAASSSSSINDGSQSSTMDEMDTNQMSSIDSTVTAMPLIRSEHDDSTLFIKLQKLLDIEGSFASSVWVDNRLLALLPTPTRNKEVVAQVWALDELQCAKLLARLVMVPAQLEECAHSSFALESSPDANHTVSRQGVGLTSLDFDVQTGCLAVSSYLILKSDFVQLFSCVWNWRTNTLGLTIRCRSHVAVRRDVHGLVLASQSAMVQLKFCSDSSGGRKLVHLFSILYPHWGVDHRLRKVVYDLAILSPPDSIHQPRNGFRLPSPLILGSKSVSFPVHYYTTSYPNGEVEWRESRFPPSYTSSFGTPKIAAIGHRKCRSIAVASSKGLCVLDCSRLASSSISTKSEFVNMKGHIGTPRSGRTSHPKWRLFGSEHEEQGFKVITMTWWEGDDHGDDLLLAVIERNEGSQRKLYLACWSRRRLGFGNQLIRGIIPEDRTCDIFGIELPSGFLPGSISILSDPRNPSTHTDRRASLLLCSYCGDEPVSYCFYQLQEVRLSTSSDDLEQSNTSVLCFLGARGTVCDDVPFCNSSIFLASSSFDFNLSYPETTTNVDVYTSLGTLGIIKYPGLGIRGAIVTTGGVSIVVKLKPLVDVSSFFVSAVLTTERDSIYVWGFELTDGRVLCWSLSSNASSHVQSAFSLVDDAKRPLATAPFDPPSQIKIDDEGNSFMGTISSVGNSTMWMQDSLNRNRSDILIGCVPGNEYGCTMKVGQGSKALHRMVPGDFDGSVFACGFLDHDLFCPSDTILATPAFVVALVNLLLGKAKPDTNYGKTAGNHHMADLFCYFRLSMWRDSCEDPFVSALKILILRFVEMIASSCTSGTSATKELAQSLYRDVITLAREHLSASSFAGLILGIGRQIEPSCYPHLFPVPGHSTTQGGDSVEDIMDVILQQGSLNFALSTLPLLPSKSLSLDKCRLLLRHCFGALAQAIRHSNGNFDSSAVERSGILSLTRFGLQLEDAENEEDWEVAVCDVDPVGGDIGYVDHGLSNQGQMKLLTNRNQSTKLSSGSIVLSLFCLNRKSKAVQIGIAEAASAFIAAGFEESDYEFVGTPSGVVTSPEKHVQNASVAEVVAEFLSSLLTTNVAMTFDTKWSSLSLLAQLLIGDSSAALSDLLPLEMNDFAEVAEATSLHNLASAVHTLRIHVDDNSVDSINAEKVVVDFLVSNFLVCRHGISRENASQLLDLVLRVVSRLRKQGCHSSLLHVLLLIGVVTGLVADREADIFEFSTKCPLFVCYKLAVDDAEGTI